VKKIVNIFCIKMRGSTISL